MKILQRYVGWSFVKFNMLILIFLMTIVSFCNMVSDLGDVNHGSYGFLQLFLYTLMTLPNWLYPLFPMICLLASILSLGQLASKSELIVMRAAGISRHQIAWMVLRMGFVLTLIAFVIGEGVTPALTREATMNRTIAMDGKAAVVPIAGGWLHIGNHFINVGEVPNLSGDIWKNVSIYTFGSDQQLLTMMYAAEVDYQEGVWHADHAAVSNLTYQGDQVVQSQSEQDVPDLILPDINIKPEMVRTAFENDAATDPSLLTLKQLNQLVHYKKTNDLSYSAIQLSLWQRLLQPVETLIMIFLAVPFVFGSLRHASMGVRLTVGVVVGFIFYLLTQYVGFLSLVYNVSPIISASLPLLLIVLFALFLIRKRF